MERWERPIDPNHNERKLDVTLSTHIPHSNSNTMYLLEHWKQVPGFEGKYEVSNVGNVRGKTGILRRAISTRGYHIVSLYKDGKAKTCFVHRLVGEAFIGRLGELHTNHKNGWKLLNWLSNLEYVTRENNMKHAAAMGLISKKLTKEDADRIREMTHLSNRALSKLFGVSAINISNIRKNRIWV